ncbi:MAG: DUF5837 family cyanobactin class RiPP [Cyanobacteria bacterium P01_G01_bin.54]
MSKKNISPNPQQPIERKPAGQLTSALAELSEAPLSGAQIQATRSCFVSSPCSAPPPCMGMCSFDGDEE